MADSKISALTELASADLADADLLPIVDVSEATDALKNKKTLWSSIVSRLRTLLLGGTGITGATVTTSQPLISHSQTWNASGVAFLSWVLNVTKTAAAAGSKMVDFQVGGVSKLGITTEAGLPGGDFGLQFQNSGRIGAYGTGQDHVGIGAASQGYFAVGVSGSEAGFVKAKSDAAIGFTSAGNANNSLNVCIRRIADKVMGVRTGTAACALSLSVFTVANLPTAANAGAGALASVSDATVTTVGTTVAGGGSSLVTVRSDGTDWKIVF